MKCDLSLDKIEYKTGELVVAAMTALRERRKTAPLGRLRREIEKALKMGTKN
ncbi:MAG: hypothetical protein ABI210_02700 [Abditibacteriaceae bacterium]